MIRKTVLMAAVLAVAGVSTQAMAHDDAVLGAVLGAGVGAVIGHSVSGRDGAVIGGAVGAVAGAAIADQGDGRYERTHWNSPAPVYAPAPRYYEPQIEYRRAPVYVERSVYEPRWGGYRYEQRERWAHERARREYRDYREYREPRPYGYWN